MVDYLNELAEQADSVAHEASVHNNETPWVGQTNPNTGQFVPYMEEDYEKGTKLRECADMIGSMAILMPADTNVSPPEPSGETWKIGDHMCPNCGEPIHPEDPWKSDGRGHRFCSQECLDSI
jgi:hypothetical protein